MFIRASVSIICPLNHPTKMDKNNIEFLSIVKWKNKSINLREVENLLRRSQKSFIPLFENSIFTKEVTIIYIKTISENP